MGGVVLGALKLVERGGAARFAWDEFFYAEHHNPHTQQAYKRAVRRFLTWVQGQGIELVGITPGMVGAYFDEHRGSLPTKKVHLAAIRAFFIRHMKLAFCRQAGAAGSKPESPCARAKARSQGMQPPASTSAESSASAVKPFTG